MPRTLSNAEGWYIFAQKLNNMSQTFGNMFAGRSSRKGGPSTPKFDPTAVAPRVQRADRKQTYSKVFRWRLPHGQTQEPVSVEIVGTFTQWQRLPLVRERAVDAWHITLDDIQCNRTHHYMLLVDGKPVPDKNSDGLAIPHGPQEEQFQLMTARGPRVFMLFAQTM